MLEYSESSESSKKYWFAKY